MKTQSTLAECRFYHVKEYSVETIYIFEPRVVLNHINWELATAMNRDTIDDNVDWEQSTKKEAEEYYQTDQEHNRKFVELDLDSYLSLVM